MTSSPDTVFTAALGMAYISTICNSARTLFRPLPFDDVGIDGMMELTAEGQPLGVICGIQSKSGSSFVANTSGTRFRFEAEAKNWQYWSKCRFPVIGIVFSPEHQRAVWLDLKSYANGQRTIDGGSVYIDYSEETAFNAINVLTRIAGVVMNHTINPGNQLGTEQTAKADLLSSIIQTGSELGYKELSSALVEIAIKSHIKTRLPSFQILPLQGVEPYDLLIRDDEGEIKIEIKNQYTKKGRPVLANEVSRNYPADAFFVHLVTPGDLRRIQAIGNRVKYPFETFDILAVSLFRSTGDINSFMYTVSRWIPEDKRDKNRMVAQLVVPVNLNNYWTNSIETCVSWFRSKKNKKMPG